MHAEDAERRQPGSEVQGRTLRVKVLDAFLNHFSAASAYDMLSLEGRMVEKVNLREKLGQIREHWKPRIAAEVNETLVKLVKFKGEFVWHHHDREDELFLVVEGSFRMQLEGREIVVREGELVVIPRGVEHRPVADEECSVVLIEPKTTLNTGNVVNERTLPRLERI